MENCWVHVDKYELKTISYGTGVMQLYQDLTNLIYLFETLIWSNIDGAIYFWRSTVRSSQPNINKIKIYKENMHNLITLQSTCYQISKFCYYLHMFYLYFFLK